jgi:hypothetical protein
MSDIPSSVAFTTRGYANAPTTTLLYSATATQTTIDVATPTHWPNVPYFAVIDRSSTSQEVVEVTLVTVISGGVSLTVTRSANNGGAYAHGAGAGIELAGVARDWAEMMAHRTDTARDDHPGLMMSNGNRHDLAARHLLGTTIATGFPGTSSVGDVAAEGVSTGISRADHAHGSSITTAELFSSFLPVGLIVPIEAAAITYPAALPSGLLWCDGGWYPRSSYPALALGGSYPPFSALQSLAGLPSGVQALSGYQGAYSATGDFAVPCMLFWTRGATAPQWYLSPPQTPLPLGWAIVAGT